MKIQNAILPGHLKSIPTFGSLRSWVLRYGYYKLNKPVEKANDWILIQDHSSQVGDDKIHVILGIRVKKLKEVGFQPTLDDVEPLVVRPVKSSKGDVVKEALDEAYEKIGGSPVQIIGDGGSDGRCGAKLFIENNPNCILSYDIAHKLNIFLKSEIADDEGWNLFKKNTTSTMQKIKQSKLSHILPPPQRTKSRLFSEFQILKWGCDLYDYYQRKEYDGIDSSYVEEKIGWIKNFKKHLTLYQDFTKVAMAAKAQVGEHGYQQKSATVFKKHLRSLKVSKRAINFGKKISDFLEEEGAKVPNGKIYLGSDEVIESLFGKFKSLEDHHASRGFGSLVLALPGLVGEISEADIHAAMEEVKNYDVLNWVKFFFGDTFLSRRRKAFQQGRNVEQNLHEKHEKISRKNTSKTWKNACEKFVDKITNYFQDTSEAEC